MCTAGNACHVDGALGAKASPDVRGAVSPGVGSQAVSPRQVCPFRSRAVGLVKRKSSEKESPY